MQTLWTNFADAMSDVLFKGKQELTVLKLTLSQRHRSQAHDLQYVLGMNHKAVSTPLVKEILSKESRVSRLHRKAVVEYLDSGLTLEQFLYLQGHLSTFDMLKLNSKE